jgi:hypothetical protein
MMAEHIWSVLCLRGVIDQLTGQVSLVDIVEGFRLDLTPAEDSKLAKSVNLSMPLTLVSLWLRSDPGAEETVEIRVPVITPDGSEIVPTNTLTAHIDKSRLRTFQKLEEFPNRGSGQYRLAVECRHNEADAWRRVASIPIEVDIRAPEGQEAPGPMSRRRVRAKTRR